jgi:hypothetical protein
MSIEEHQCDLSTLIISPKSDQNLIEFITQNKHEQVKLHIDDKLISIFNSGKRVALVKNIDLIPARAMLLFYTYGDDMTNAKFPGKFAAIEYSEGRKLYEYFIS